MAGWQSIRLLRASPPELVTSERLGVFASALEQSEQLMRAARDVGPAARPLPLFYALSQAGRAIAASRLTGDAWRLAGHGLSEPVEQPQGGDFLRRVINPRAESEKRVRAGRRASFAGVADATGSDSLTRGIELGAVWAALPHLMPPDPQMPDLDPNWPRPLRAYPSPDDDGSPESVALLDRRPLELLLGLSATPKAVDEQGLDRLLDEITRVYPSSEGIAVPWWQGRTELVRHWAPSGEFLPAFCWPDVRHPVRIEQLDAIAPAGRGDDDRMLLPRVGGRDALSPLMLWWVLLFGLSMIARYDPEVWVAVLNVNESPQAVPLEAALDTALAVLPNLILEALVAHPDPARG